MVSPDARARIVAAALEDVREHGWAATSMQQVRERAGVSNGSLFHHFPSRTDLEAAVLGRALSEHQATMLGILARSRSQRSGVRNIVRGHLEWVAANRGLAILLLTSLPGVLRQRIDEVARGENVQFFDQVAVWLRSQGWPGSPELFVMTAMWLGPANDLARNTMSLGAEAPSGPLIDILADAAWNSLSPHLGKEKT